MRWHIIQGILLKYYYITKNRLDRLFDVFYWPTIDVLVWGLTTYYISSLSENFIIGFFLGGAVLWSIFNRANTDMGVFILEDFWSRNLPNFYSTPARISEVIVALCLNGLFRAIASFAFLSVLTFILYAFNIFSIKIIYVLVFFIFLLVFGWIVGLFVAGLIFRFGMRIQVLAWGLGWLMQPVSCVFYPLNSLPVWLQKVAVWFPTTHIFEGMREILMTGTFSLISLFNAIVLTVLFAFLSVLFFYSSFNKAKKTGLLTRLE
ncbi:ABC transporter permease [Nanoarchaeota archaeon]